MNNVKIHSTAEVQTKHVGEGTSVWQHCVVLSGAKVGKNCNINSHCFVENDVCIGDNVTVKCGVYVWDGITLENNVFVGPNVTFTNDKNPRSKMYPQEFMKTLVGEGASIGAGSIILGGANIGRYALIGAGSLVTKNVPDFTLWYGSPATQRGYVCLCGKKLPDRLECDTCARNYEKKVGGGLALVSKNV